MLNEDEYLTKLNNLERDILKLEEQKRQISNKVKILTAQKEDLQNAYNLAKIRNRPDASQWIETTFEWSEEITKLLKEKFKFKTFKSKQLAAINATLSKKDVILLMPTGGGKSLVYQLPALVDKRLTLVVSPLISLIQDQLIALKKFDIKAATLNSSSTKEEKTYVYQCMKNETSTLNVLYVTPEWVAKSKIFMSNLQKCFGNGCLSRIVIDEVHCCSTWGHDFRTEYGYLGFFKSMFPGVPILGLTATATMHVLVDIQQMLGLEDALIITAPFNRPNLYYKITSKPPDKKDCLDVLEMLLKHNYKDQSGIIYSSTIKECEELYEGLRERGLAVKYYHAQLEARDKQIIHQRWLQNKYQAVIATIAFGMGIDKPDVRFVIHHCVPKSMEGLYQESGRAGRDGKKADCILMFSLHDYLRNVSMASSKTEEKNSMSILEYCLDQKRCRRAIIAEHFEDKWNQTDCDKMCDHCKYSKEISHYDISSALRDILNINALASSKEIKLTLNKLISGWFQSGAKELRNVKLMKPTCSKEQAEHIIGFLILKGYLKITKGFTMYTTIPYLQEGRSFSANETIIMPYGARLRYEKVAEPSGIIEIDSDPLESEPPRKRKKD